MFGSDRECAIRWIVNRVQILGIDGCCNHFRHIVRTVAGVILDVEVRLANDFLSNVVIPPFFKVGKRARRDFGIYNVHIDHDKALFAVAVANAERLQMVDRPAFG